MQSLKQFYYTRDEALSGLVSGIESNLSIKLTKYEFNIFETHIQLKVSFKLLKTYFVSFIDKFDSIPLTKLDNAPSLV